MTTMSNVTAINPEIGYLNRCYEEAQAKRAKLESDIEHYATLSIDALASLEEKLADAHFHLLYDGFMAMQREGRAVTPRNFEDNKAHYLELGQEHADRIMARVWAKRA
jgi:hypothetical protein